MKDIAVIEKLMDEILEEEIDFLSLKNKLDDFKSFLIKLTGLDLKNQSNKEDIQFENGIALSPTFAALCVNDIIRTRQFIRGIYQAVTEVRLKKDEPVTIFYAGTGPFATLVLPLLTKFSPKELQITLLEVNEKTMNFLKKVIQSLGIEDYIQRMICEDASKYIINEDSETDILISETMQHGLVKEQQVPIMINLVHQMHKDVIMIPNNIQLDLALMNTSTKLLLEGLTDLKYKNIKNVLNFDKEFIHSYTKETPNWKQNHQFKLCERVPFIEDNDNDFDKVVILTSIQVYNNEWINVDSSGLTIPKILFPLQEIKQQEKEISLSYIFSGNPYFNFELS